MSIQVRLPPSISVGRRLHPAYRSLREGMPGRIPRRHRPEFMMGPARNLPLLEADHHMPFPWSTIVGRPSVLGPGRMHRKVWMAWDDLSSFRS